MRGFAVLREPVHGVAAARPGLQLIPLEVGDEPRHELPGEPSATQTLIDIGMGDFDRARLLFHRREIDLCQCLLFVIHQHNAVFIGSEFHSSPPIVDSIIA